MDPQQQTCPDCGSILHNRSSCEDNFHQMLFWENEDPQKGVVHHLMILAYHLQHPHLYSPEGLEYSLHLLVDFVEYGASPQQVRKQSQPLVDSNRRKWKIRGTPKSHASYKNTVRWSMTAQDVITAGPDLYSESVQRWARTVLLDLRLSGNLA